MAWLSRLARCQETALRFVSTLLNLPCNAGVFAWLYLEFLHPRNDALSDVPLLCALALCNMTCNATGAIQALRGPGLSCWFIARGQLTMGQFYTYRTAGLWASHELNMVQYRRAGIQRSSRIESKDYHLKKRVPLWTRLQMAGACAPHVGSIHLLFPLRMALQWRSQKIQVRMSLYAYTYMYTDKH